MELVKMGTKLLENIENQIESAGKEFFQVVNKLLVIMDLLLDLIKLFCFKKNILKE